MSISELRVASRRELASIVDWVTDAHTCELWSGGQESFPIDRTRWVSVVSPAGAVQLVLESDDRIVGFARYQLLDPLRAHLSRLLVDPAERGRGFGSTLVAQLLDRARDDGAETATLWVSPENSAAFAAYRRAGFAPTAPPPNRRQVSSTNVFMSRALP